MSLWALARIDLGLSSEEFWSLTPREFSFLAARHAERIKVFAALSMGGLMMSKKPSNLVDFLDGK